MKKLQKLMALMMALMMLLGVVPAMAEGAQSPAAENLGEPGAIAYLMFADGAWVNQVWNPGERPAGMTITEAPIYGEGDYSVGIAFDGVHLAVFHRCDHTDMLRIGGFIHHPVEENNVAGIRRLGFPAGKVKGTAEFLHIRITGNHHQVTAALLHRP
jgi:hypothetical protein